MEHFCRCSLAEGLNQRTSNISWLSVSFGFRIRLYGFRVEEFPPWPFPGHHIGGILAFFSCRTTHGLTLTLNQKP